jgi:cell filamentation protein
LRSLERDAFIDRLTYYLGEVNAIHPFREGNGRTQRAFFEQLAYDAGFTLAWQHLDAARNIATLAAARCISSGPAASGGQKASTVVLARGPARPAPDPCWAGRRAA